MILEGVRDVAEVGFQELLVVAVLHRLISKLNYIMMWLEGIEMRLGGNQGFLFFLLRVFTVFLGLSSRRDSRGSSSREYGLKPESSCSILKDSS